MNHTNEIYSPEEVRSILELVATNPRGFLRLAKKHCKTVTPEQVKRSMIAWGLDPNDGYQENPDSRLTRNRKNISNSELS